MLVVRSGLSIVERVAISPDGQFVICAKSNIKPTICRTNSSHKPVFVKCKEKEYAEIKLFFSPDGTLFGSKGRLLLTFDAKTGRQLTCFAHDSEERFANGLLSTGANRLAITSFRTRTSPSKLEMWEIMDDGIPTLLWRNVGSMDSGYWNLALANNDKMLIASYGYGYGNTGPKQEVVIHDCGDGRVIRTIRHPFRFIMGLAGMQDGSYAAGYCDTKVLVFDTSTDAEPRIIHNDVRRHFTGIAFHPFGRWLAAASNDETVKFYDTESWQVAKTFGFRIGRMRSVAFSPDGTLAAAGSDTGQVVLWDVD
jgi:WD40 repeat protein